METKLAENIKAFRKERSLTREQLSEVLGVTPGAVYKWEAKLSIPELDLSRRNAVSDGLFILTVSKIISY